ncbi:PucR family transcriptional regulator [Streptomyces sp. NPDC096013]|uniref:PucR family transcriptional regulator n=1 Tax=Streptomyces sp. NPDC096013 TaxID=3366069 RepID=UPI0038008FE3
MLRSRLLAERAAERLLADIASYDPQVVEGDFLVFRAAELGFELRLQRVAVAFEVSVPHPVPRRQGGTRPLGMPLVRSERLRTVGEIFADPQDVVASTAPGWIGVLHRLPVGCSATSLVADCRRVSDLIAAQDGLVARAGIGEPATSVGGLHDSYQDACDALRLGARFDEAAPVHLITDLRVHQVVTAVSQAARNRLLDLTATELRAQPDWPALRDTVTAWCESGFNLVRTAEALHIHRNTVVYRMNKIEQITGRSLREYRTAMTLYVACPADRLSEQRVRPRRPGRGACGSPRRTSPGP